MSKTVKLFLVSLLVFAFSAVAFAQSTTTGAIGGVVTNPAKEVVPGAAITVRNMETNKEDTATTDDTGRFKVANLQPGRYAVTINSSGFSPLTQENVVVEIGRETPLEVALQVGPVTGTVDVSAEAPVINTTQQDFSTNINQTSINELPINGRRWSNFALLTPGAVPDGTFGLISFRGISGLLNNNTIDGGDNNQAFFAEERGRTRISYSISQAAIREFQVNTSSYSAEYGRSAGGVVNAITKSGTNELHGGAFYYQRNNKWGARNPLATRSVPNPNGPGFVSVGFKPEDVRHQFGGTIGGPIVKDKAFFFFSYDQQKRDFPGLSIFSQNGFLNTVNRTNIRARGLSEAQIDQALSFLNSLTGPVPRTGDQKLFLPKVDWIINDANTLTVSYNRLRWESPAGIQTQATNTRAIDNFGDDFVQIDAVNVKLASTLSPTLLNEFRMQWGRDNEFQFSQPPAPGEPTNAPGGRSPQTFIQNGFSFGMPEFLERAAFPDERRWQFADTVTLTSGNHTLKFGGDVNFVKDIINNLRFLGGEFSYTGANSLNDFIVDYINFQTNGAIRNLAPVPGDATTNNFGRCVGSTRRAGKCYAGSFTQGFGVLGLTMKTTDFNYFIQDDWRVTPRFTLNLGLRYEYQLNPDPINVNPDVPQTNRKVDDRDNFGPRVGFAFDVTGDGRTSIRGGWGLYYGRVINSTVYNTLVNTGVGVDRGQRQFSTSANNLPAACSGISADNCAFLPIYPNLLSASNAPVGAIQFFQEDFQLPQIHQWDFILEREIARNTVVSASYLGSFGNSLPNFVDTNLPPATRLVTLSVNGGPFAGATYVTPLFTGPRRDTRFAQLTEIRSNVYSKYHALVLQANRRLTAGLQFQTNYTLSRASDNGQSSVTFTTNNLPFNAFDQSGEDGLSNFDRRHKFVASVVYSPNPFSDGAAKHIFNGWTFAPIFNAFSGQRFTGNIANSINPQSFGFASNQTPGGGANGSGGANRFALVPRNFFKQPKIWYVDARLSRRFALTEGVRLELLAEGFNVFNRTQVTGVNTTIYNLVGTNLNFNPTFGTTTAADSTLFRERQIQFAARFEF
ncbi:MAG TPA: TonB-dependent receptor [Pyrinomonadaceae bacterium]|nr:TonB-dependent receptor [Pyrinomonadaceae bacterium]